MSTNMLLKDEIDALVAVAIRFTTGDPLPVDPSSSVPTRVTEANADLVGRELWVENWRLNWDLHPDIFDDLDNWNEQQWANFDPQTATPPADIDHYRYTSTDLVGPLESTATQIVGNYRYQTAGAQWSEGSYGRQFTDALEALIQRGNVSSTP